MADHLTLSQRSSLFCSLPKHIHPKEGKLFSKLTMGLEFFILNKHIYSDFVKLIYVHFTAVATKTTPPQNTPKPRQKNTQKNTKTKNKHTK